MKRYRLMLACTLLLLAAAPTFALPPCSFCDNGTCVNGLQGNQGTVCRFSGGNCFTNLGSCVIFAGRPLLATWNVASIEITRPDPATHRLTTVVITPTSAQVAAR